jgi:hypothetical protein
MIYTLKEPTGMATTLSVKTMPFCMS